LKPRFSPKLPNFLAHLQMPLLPLPFRHLSLPIPRRSPPVRPKLRSYEWGRAQAEPQPVRAIRFEDRWLQGCWFSAVADEDSCSTRAAKSTIAPVRGPSCAPPTTSWGAPWGRRRQLLTHPSLTFRVSSACLRNSHAGRQSIVYARRAAMPTANRSGGEAGTLSGQARIHGSDTRLVGTRTGAGDSRCYRSRPGPSESARVSPEGQRGRGRSSAWRADQLLLAPAARQSPEGRPTRNEAAARKPALGV
jgi:hypothetical protein